MLKKYIASYTNGRRDGIDVLIYAENIHQAKREALSQERELGLLYSVRLCKAD